MLHRGPSTAGLSLRVSDDVVVFLYFVESHVLVSRPVQLIETMRGRYTLQESADICESFC